MKKAVVMVAICTLFLSVVNAQNVVTGNVVDTEGVPLIGANVFIRNTYDGTSTNVEGSYSFTTTESGTVEVVVSFIGYQETKKTMVLKASNTVDFVVKESINKMDAVVISAGSFEGGTGTKSEVLKPLDIVTTAGATADIAGALNSLPGTQTVGEEGRLFVRGGDGNETKTFIDGLQVLKPYGTTVPNTPTRGRFSPFMFSGTSFSTGGYSAEYGQALSSALILNTKEKPTQTRTDISLMTVGAEASHTQSWATSSLAVQAAYYNLTPYYSVVKQLNDWDNEPESAQASLAARQQVGNGGMVKVYGQVSTNSFSLYQPDLLNPNTKTKVDVTNTYAYGNTSFKNTLGNSWTFKTGLAYTYNEDTYHLTSENIQELTRGLHAKAVFSGNVSNNISLASGAELLYSESSQNYKRITDGFANTFWYQNPLWSAFAETDIYLSEKFLTRVGGRMEYEAQNNRWYGAPRVSLAYKTGENAQIALAGGRFWQAPADDLYRVNPDLKFEQADHLILNYQIVGAKQTFRIEGYLKKYHQLARFNPADVYNPTAYSNTGTGYAQGIDVFWRDNKSIKNADYWVSYSLLDTQRNYRDYPVEAVPTFASAHNLSVVYKQWVPGLKTQFSVTFTAASPRRYNNPNIAEFNSEKTPAYFDLSLSVSYLAIQNIIIYGSVTNVLGRNNIFGYTYSQTPNNQGNYVGQANTLPAPRFFFLGVFITFSKEGTLNQLKSL